MYQVFIIIKKELKAIIRDRKTIIISLFLPMLILPISLYIMDSGMSNATEEATNGAIIATSLEGKETLESIFFDTADIVIIDDYEDALKRGDISLFIGYQEYENTKTFELLSNQSSIKSQYVASMTEQLLNEYKELMLVNFAASNGIKENELPNVIIKSRSLGNNSESTYYVEILLPIMLLVYGCLGITTISNDLGAGEKERKTLESLFATSVKRKYIFIGKAMVAACIGMISSVLLILGLETYLFIVEGKLWGTYSQFMVILFLSILFCVIVSIISVTISFGAKSYKEAQTINTPLSIVFLLPGYYLMAIEPGEISDLYFHIPILNITSLLKEVTGEVLLQKHIFTVVIWMLVYITIALYIGIKKVEEDSVIR